MLLKRQIVIKGGTGLLLLIAMFLIASPAVQAQNWVPIPPYNLLWPLWSPALSPPDAVTGIPIPLLNSLNSQTLLPVQPVLMWDPVIRDFPYMLYNIPQPLGGGMVFFDQYYGLNPWPPPYLTDPVTGSPVPITLPTGFAALSPTPLDPFADYVTLANLYFLSEYPAVLFPTSLSRLLTTAELWGLPPL
ncbi:MAG: hypothetical protein ACMUIL_02005 [bacterium]